MVNYKLQGKDLSIFEVGLYDQKNIAKINDKRRSINLKTQTKQKYRNEDMSLQIPLNMIDDFNLASIDQPRNQYINVNINNYGTISNQNQTLYAGSEPFKQDEKKY